MRKFLAKLALFSALPAAFAAALFLVDPYNLFHRWDLVPASVKKETSYRINYALWKVAEFKRSPCPNVLFGDSRMNNIDTSALDSVAGERYYNFALGGGTLPEICRLFWFAAGRSKLENVYIGINFNLYNRLNSMDRASGAVDVERNPLAYFCNTNVLQSAMRCLGVRYLGWDPVPSEPPMGREEFWRHQLSEVTAGFYARYLYPEDSRRELERIAAYCRAHGARLTFIIFPTHVDLQRKVSAFGLDGAQARFKRDLAALAPTLDFDYPNELTERRGNFNDPYHYNREVGRRLIEEIWGNRRAFAAVSGPSALPAGSP